MRLQYISYYLLFFVITVCFAYINTMSTEPFTPMVRELYRPLVRKTRMTGEGLYNTYSAKMTNFFRKWGLYS